jgi:hypothetical protein
MHAGRLRGMGVRQGVTLIVGGGFHGKSTLLEALEAGVYNKVRTEPICCSMAVAWVPCSLQPSHLLHTADGVHGLWSKANQAHDRMQRWCLQAAAVALHDSHAWLWVRLCGCQKSAACPAMCLQQLSHGCGNSLGQVPGDGREHVATVPTAVKIRAEDGRRVEATNISPFISNLPFGALLAPCIS